MRRTVMERVPSGVAGSRLPAPARCFSRKPLWRMRTWPLRSMRKLVGMAWTPNWRGDRAFGIVFDAKIDRRLLQEGVGECALLVDVHGENDEAILGVALLQFVHPRKGLQAGRAPGGPEVDQDDLAGKRLEQRPAGRGHGRRGRGGAGGCQCGRRRRRTSVSQRERNGILRRTADSLV